jgi:hypothetical protein
MNWGQEQTEAAMALQKALLESCDQASRTWLARVQSEVVAVVRFGEQAERD